MLIKQAEMHDNYAMMTRHIRAGQGAVASKNACLAAYDTIGDDDQTPRVRAESICATTGTAVIALNEAGRLQCLPRHVITAAAVMLDEVKSA
jgi:hypothetical protein